MQLLKKINKIGKLLALLSFATAFLSAPVVSGQDMLDLEIPHYVVENVTMEKAIRELNRWGLQVCLEKAAGSEISDITFSIDIKNVSIREVLTSITSKDNRYTWERYRRGGVHPTKIINVFPVIVKKDPSYVMNLKTEKTSIKSVSPPENLFQRVGYFVPELAKILFPNDRGGPGSVLEGSDYYSNIKVEFEFKNLTVRDILNEIALITHNSAWLYETDSTIPGRHRWRIL